MSIGLPNNFELSIVVMSTLKERFSELSKARERGWKAALSRHCNVSAASVSDWSSGKTLRLDGAHILSVASFFKVRPLWMATGRGKKQLDEGFWPFSEELLDEVVKLESAELLRTENVIRALLGLQQLMTPETNQNIALQRAPKYINSSG